MKQIVLAFAILFLGAFSTIAQNTTKAVKTSTSVVNWKGYKVTGKHEGVVAVKSGNLIFAGDVLKGGEFTIDMASLSATDLTGKGKESLEGHLKSDDFFGTAKYPEAKFVITKVVSRGKPGEYKIVGNLTIKTTTKEIKFDATTNGANAIAAIKIDRSDFDIKFGSGSFMENLGDKTIYDEFDMNVNLAY
jgi:polyisoprenoid-binding protein YceI